MNILLQVTYDLVADKNKYDDTSGIIFMEEDFLCPKGMHKGHSKCSGVAEIRTNSGPFICLSMWNLSLKANRSYDSRLGMLTISIGLHGVIEPSREAFLWEC